MNQKLDRVVITQRKEIEKQKAEVEQLKQRSLESLNPAIDTPLPTKSYLRSYLYVFISVLSRVTMCVR